MNKKNKTKFIYWSISIIIVVAIVYTVINNQGVPINIERPEILGRDHVADLSNYQYSSNPPTSGNHFSNSADSGFYDEQVPDGELVHSLEHGYVIINYDCSKFSGDCEELKSEIKFLVNDDSWKVIGNPRPENDYLISVTSWGKLMHLDEFNRDKIKTFINKYRNQGPEKTEH